MQGTSYWMAPEVFKGEGYDSKIDIWSVGCVVLEMWTAKRPWDGYNLLPVWYKVSSFYLLVVTTSFVLKSWLS